MEQVILVDRSNHEIGLMEKQEAHVKGLLHRAFSVFIFNEKNELLLQQRAFEKYHSGGLWTNTCCSHPRKNESILAAAKRRLVEEMGFVAPVSEIFEFIYEAKLDNGLTEHEYDHVLIGRYNQEPKPNPDEVANWKYIDLTSLKKDMKENRENYTVWFLEIFDRVEEHLLKHMV
ncbi:isopentenyl-diphosphate Delta-isomerase [Crocinitomix algicola]|uniref:isopentenyl-diphosphate Delta-isomerase n=1 Tax=Crocinitomix algicola TaxID=1740263 RepID=UPI00087254C4|nr:isopentenyl-diphosphate Delta-isomerase [Crocinitomix algicola]